jgi:hypothetical protein
MSSPDPLVRINEQSRIARSAIAEAQAIITGTIMALERSICSIRADAEGSHVERADPPFPPES